MNLSKEAIKEFREMRLDIINQMLATADEVTKAAGAPGTDVLLVRRELLEKQKDIQLKMEASADLDEEEIQLLSIVDNEEDDGHYT